MLCHSQYILVPALCFAHDQAALSLRLPSLTQFAVVDVSLAVDAGGAADLVAAVTAAVDAAVTAAVVAVVIAGAVCAAAGYLVQQLLVVLALAILR